MNGISPKKPRKTEDIAIDAVKTFYENQGYNVTIVDVKTYYDLIAKKGDEKLLVEVKGTRDRAYNVNFNYEQFNAFFSEPQYKLHVAFINKHSDTVIQIHEFTKHDVKKIDTNFRVHFYPKSKKARVK